MADRACLVFLTRAAEGGPQVLLALKKRGFGAGKIVGPGGHLEAGETALEAAVREVAEEVGVRLAPCDVVPAGVTAFRFPARPAWDMTVALFTAARFEGVPTESDEVAPTWYDSHAIPFDDVG